MPGSPKKPRLNFALSALPRPIPLQIRPKNTAANKAAQRGAIGVKTGLKWR
jgi:hypothetical protein